MELPISLHVPPCHSGLGDDCMSHHYYYQAKAGFSTYCRQTLLGGNYGLVDKDTLMPNPDYYNFILFSQLMGPKVCSSSSSSSSSSSTSTSSTSTSTSTSSNSSRQLRVG